MTPISITSHDGIVYVLNAGGTPNIAGFDLNSTGMLAPIAGSVQPLSGVASSSPEQIGFDNVGRVLVVTEKASNIIDTYTVNMTGAASQPVCIRPTALVHTGSRSIGMTDLSSAKQLNTLSSYAVSDNGSLS